MFGSWRLHVPQIAGGERSSSCDDLLEDFIRDRALPPLTLKDDYLSLTPEEEGSLFSYEVQPQMVPSWWCFDLGFSNFMVVQKENSFSRNCTSNFDLFPGYQHAPWYSLTHELQRTQKSQNSLEEVQSWRTTTLFQILWYSYSKQHV